MGMAAMGLQAAQGVMSAAGSVIGGYSTAASDRYQAQVAQNNAVLAANSANVAQAQGDVQAQTAYQQGSQRLGAARAAEGANGVTLNSGSALDVQSGIARTTALNVQAIKYNADVQAVGLRNQVANYDSQASVDKAAASNAITGGYLGAAGSLIGSASGIADKWSSLQSALPASNSTIDGYNPSTGGTNGFGTSSNPFASSMLSGAF